MASPGGTSSGSSALQQISSPDQDQEELLVVNMDEKKRKRMESNRKSARRSRMRKQQHLDDLMAQVANLRKENSDLVTELNLTTHNYLTIEAENCVLGAQVAELTSRLQSLDQILNVLDATNHGHGHGHGIGAAAAAAAAAAVFGGEQTYPTTSTVNELTAAADCFMISPWTALHFNQPIMANADIFQ
ncbi:hypothetical protein Dimus_000066 [Dionaea muscipula]